VDVHVCCSGEVIVDYQLHTSDVETSSGYIGGDED
jgi:hypothetical protein